MLDVIRRLIRPWFVYEEIRTTPEEVVFRSNSLKSGLRGLVTGVLFAGLGTGLVVLSGWGPPALIISVILGGLSLGAFVRGAAGLFSQGALIVHPVGRELTYLKKTPWGTRRRSFAFDEIACVRRDERRTGSRKDGKPASYVGHVWIETKGGDRLGLGEGGWQDSAGLAHRLSELLEVEERYTGEGAAVRVAKPAGPCPKCGMTYAYDGTRCGHCET